VGPKKCGTLLRRSKYVRLAFIDRYRSLLPRVHPCRLLAVADRSLRAWRGWPAPRRLRTDMALTMHIKGQYSIITVIYGKSLTA
jgi:hypothetical protein